MGLVSFNEEFNVYDLPDNDSITSNYHSTGDFLVVNLEILDENNDSSLCPISLLPLFERNDGDTSSKGSFSMNNSDDYLATSLPYPPPNFEENLRMDHVSIDCASIRSGDNDAPATVSETQHNAENMEIFFNIESEGSSIETIDDTSLYYVHNPVYCSPEILDYHSDKNSVLDADCMNAKVHLVYLCQSQDLATYIPK